LWGQRPEIGRDLWCGSYRIYRPDGTRLPLDHCPMAVTLREGRSVRGEEIIVERPDGTRRTVLPYPDPIRDAAGRIVGAVNMLLDVTEAKRTEDASRQLAAIVESSQDAIISKDLNGVITSWNQGAERLFGYQAKEIVGRPVTVLMPPARVNEEPSILERVRSGRPVDHYETVRLRKDGTSVEVSLTVSPIRDVNGKIIGASKIVRDITEKKLAERQLKEAHEEAVAASHAKDEFLAALSHELRTPLNPVLMIASEAAEDPEIPGEVRAQFATIRNNVELEAHLIDDLLDITRITQGKLSLEANQVDVHVVLNEAIDTVQSELQMKGIDLEKEFAATKPTVVGDAVRLQQVFWNLLKNAVKFTPEKGTIIICTRTEKSGKLLVTVTDTGIGITTGELGRIFDAFAQGDHGGTRESHRFGGLGLGLAISKKLVEMHQGSIEASSLGRNQGATFLITLPVSSDRTDRKEAPDQAGSAPRTAEHGHSGPIRILLVEDHEPTRTVLANLLVRRRYEVKTASTIAEAWALSDKHEFQLLISDIGLPDGSGYDLMREMLLRHKDLQGIALTGYGMEQDIAKGQAAGFRIHLTKPVRITALETALSTVASPHC
jgi:PAS domain S-box-containing protein